MVRRALIRHAAQRRPQAATTLTAAQRTHMIGVRDAIAAARRRTGSVRQSCTDASGEPITTDAITLDDERHVVTLDLSPETQQALLRLQALMDDADPESDVLAILERSLTALIEDQ